MLPLSVSLALLDPFFIFVFGIFEISVLLALPKAYIYQCS